MTMGLDTMAHMRYGGDMSRNAAKRAVNIRLPADLIRTLKIRAAREGVTLSALVERAVRALRG